MDLTSETILILGAVLFLLAAWLVHHFAAPKTACFIRLLVTISFALGFGGIALLPIDLTITTVFDSDANADDGKYATTIAPNATYPSWMIVYWSTFLLAWVILPLFRESLLSGQFTFTSRLRSGCKVALRGYCMLAVVAITSIIVLAIKLKSWHVVPVLMALGNTYGLLLVSLLLGYGLVDLPRQVWRQANAEMELRRTRIIASNADEALYQAVWELQDTEALIDAVAAKVGDASAANGSSGSTSQPMDISYANCVDKLLTLRKSTATLSPEMQRRRATGNGSSRRQSDEDRNNDEGDDGGDSGGYPTVQSLAKLNRRLEHAQAEVVGAEQRWNSLLAKSQLYAELVDRSLSRPQRLDIESTDAICTKFCKVTGCLHSHVRYFWLVCLRGPIYRILGMVYLALSIMVIWSEMTLALPYNLSPFAILLRIFDGDTETHRSILFQLSAMIPLMYIALCVYSSMFKVTFFGSFRLRGHKQSPGVALVFNAQYLVRLQFPLAYNYLNMIKYDTSTTDCAFSHVMSHMETVPFFGTSFTIYAPLLILVVCGFTLCNGYARVLGALGFEHEDAILIGDQETMDSKVNEGITLLRRHKSNEDDGVHRSKAGGLRRQASSSSRSPNLRDSIV